MSKKKKKGKKNYKKKLSYATKPNQINQVAKDLFGSRYYCIGDNPEHKQTN